MDMRVNYFMVEPAISIFSRFILILGFVSLQIVIEEIQLIDKIVYLVMNVELKCNFF